MLQGSQYNLPLTYRKHLDAEHQLHLQMIEEQRQLENFRKQKIQDELEKQRKEQEEAERQLAIEEEQRRKEQQLH